MGAAFPAIDASPGSARSARAPYAAWSPCWHRRVTSLSNRASPRIAHAPAMATALPSGTPGQIDQGPQSAVTRGMDSSVRVTTTYPLSFPKPQPPVQRASRRELGPERDGGGRGGDLCLPEGLTPTQRRGIIDQLAQTDRAVAQQLVDELAGRMRITDIRNPIRYCAALNDRWRRGEFAPELAPTIAAERLARRRAEAPPSSSSSAAPSSSSAQLSGKTATSLPSPIRASFERLRSKFEVQSRG